MSINLSYENDFECIARRRVKTEEECHHAFRSGIKGAVLLDDERTIIISRYEIQLFAWS